MYYVPLNQQIILLKLRPLQCDVSVRRELIWHTFKHILVGKDIQRTFGLSIYIHILLRKHWKHVYIVFIFEHFDCIYGVYGYIETAERQYW